jgi:hypothetical protein
MAYLDTADYSLRISVDHLITDILPQAAESSGFSLDQVRTNAERRAMAYVKSYLVGRYNIDAEFANTGSSRDFLVMSAVIDLSLCTLHKTINPRDIPEQIANACVAVEEWLEQVRDGEIILSIPPKPTGTGDVIGMQNTFLGSQNKFISKPYTDASIYGDQK